MHQCYTSSDGSSIIQFEKGIYVSWDSVIDYEWIYTKGSYSVYGFRKEICEKDVEIAIYNKDGQNVEDARNHIFEIFESDVKRGTPGKIWFNDYYLECFVIGTSNSNYYKRRQQHTKFKIVCADPTWHREVVHQFRIANIAHNGVDLPNDMPHDLGLPNDSPIQTINNDCIVNCPFRLVIWGSCTNPMIEIAGHKYGINGTIASNEHVEINAIKDIDIRSIEKIANGDGSKTNWFGHRYMQESIFEPIPAGNIVVSWSGSFGFDLYLLESRSEPPFEVFEEEVVEHVYVFDYYGEPILDAYGDRIEMEG